jgi:ABC-type transport system substrate-binding protein
MRQSVLLAAIVCTSTAVGVGWLVRCSNMKPMQHVVMAFPAKVKPQFIDPADIQTAEEANVVRALYSPLIEYDSTAQIVGGVSDDFRFEGNRVYFSLRKDAKLSDGSPLSVEDVYQSFLRLLKIGKKMHGNLRHFLCSSKEIKHGDLDCNGIGVSGERFYLEVEREEYFPFLMKALTSLDFTIVPRKAVNWEDPKLPIVNHKVTTGPYFLDGYGEEEFAWIFRANKYSHHYSEQLIPEIRLKIIWGDEAIAAFRSGAVHVIPSVDVWASPRVPALCKELDQQASCHATHTIRSRAISFSRRAQETLSDKDRLCVGHRIRLAIWKNLDDPSQHADLQFFPVLSEGRLNDVELRPLQEKIKRVCNDDFVPSRTLTLAMSEDDLKVYGRAIEGIKNLQIINSKEAAPWLLETSKQADMYFTSGDTAFHEDISLLSYYLQTGDFGLYGKKADDWLSDYVQTLDKSDRLQKFRSLHSKMLEQAYVVPLTQAPYFTLVRAPLSLKMSHMFAGTPFWQIKRPN